VVRPGQNGLLAPADDGPALADAIGTLLASPELRGRYGAASRAIAAAEFAEEVVVARTMELYAELLGSRWPGVGR
jgi:glycosyltransferase involved in cell wall biosynthesis